MTTARPTRVSRAVIHGAVTLALGVGLASLPSQAGAAPAPRLGAAAPAEASPRLPAENVALTWAPLYMSNDHAYTRTEALELARRFDLVSAMPQGLRDHSSAMREANPDLTLLAYSNATLASAATAAGLPEEAFAHDEAGQRVKAVDWDTWLMQPDHPAWREAADRLCLERSARGGFDGCLVDMLTLGIYARGYMTAIPADPRSGRAYTQTAYRDLMIDLAADLRARSPRLVQVGNMVENGYRYWRSAAASRPLVASAPSAQMEDFLRGAGDRVDAWPSVAEWQEDVAVVTDMEQADKVGLFTTKLWSGASAAQAAQWQAYAMATFLMGADGHSFFAFTRSRDRAGASQTNAAFEMPDDLGLPTGAMRAGTAGASGAWLRDFEHGQAVVNPTSGPVTVRSAPGATRLDGTVVEPGGSVVLPAHSGDVLRRAGEDSPGRVPVTTCWGDDVPGDDVPGDDVPGDEDTSPAPFDLHLEASAPAGGRVRPGRWTRIRVVVANHGQEMAPSGVLRVGGRGLAGRRRSAPALRGDRAKTVRVAVRAAPGRSRSLLVRVAYTAGGEREAIGLRVRIARR